MAASGQALAGPLLLRAENSAGPDGAFPMAAEETFNDEIVGRYKHLP